MLDLDNDEVFEAALLGSLGLVSYPSPAQQPAGELREHLAGLLSTEVAATDLVQAPISQCPDPQIPIQRSGDPVPAS